MHRVTCLEAENVAFIEDVLEHQSDGCPGDDGDRDAERPTIERGRQILGSEIRQGGD